MTPDQNLLYDISVQYAPTEFAANQFGAVATALKVVDKVVLFSTPVTYHRIRSVFSGAAMQMVARTLIDVRDNFTHANPATQKEIRQDANDLHQQFMTVGVRLDYDENQTLIQQAGTYGNWNNTIAGFTGNLRKLGKDTLARWVFHGVPVEPTAQAVGLAKDVQSYALLWDARRDQDLNTASHQGRAALIAALRAVATELES